ncbi:hypothetical protein BDB01DRAFT_729557 [Pilobolus umbonatus]|nr:hypothetical protein BDB01DRAFT_729557 [Pilobolus umbonatus]
MTLPDNTPPPLHTNAFLSNNNQDPPISPIKEEISTIFVVGFPEDMHEREFQNMFIFSPGFEAATLKVPTKESDDELLVSNTNNNAARKQIIGFAKFRTRKEAMDARDILNGRKVDAEKGCMLKAEMAKKNLHTKRGLLSDISTSNSTMISTTTSTSNTGSLHLKRFPKQTAFSAYEAFYSVPPALSNDLMSPTENYNDYYPDLMLVGSPPTDTIVRSHSVDTRPLDSFIKPSLSTSKFNPNRFNPTPDDDYLSKSTPLTDRNTFNNMNILFNSNINGNNTHVNNTSTQSSTGINNHHTNNHQQSYSISPSLPPSTNGLTRVVEEHNFYHDTPITRFYPIHASASTPSIVSPQTTPPPPGILSPTNSYRSLGGMLVGSSNPADQNPPCNTLYVGNLPPNTNEEELKVMFSRCPGYKRLSFKNKSNGPMCFVEFEDAIYAAQALQDLHGNPLSNSIKGGIRLSFSKNPLVSDINRPILIIVIYNPPNYCSI